jgi:hypothetical protein
MLLLSLPPCHSLSLSLCVYLSLTCVDGGPWPPEQSMVQQQQEVVVNEYKRTVELYQDRLGLKFVKSKGVCALTVGGHARRGREGGTAHAGGPHRRQLDCSLSARAAVAAEPSVQFFHPRQRGRPIRAYGRVHAHRSAGDTRTHILTLGMRTPIYSLTRTPGAQW